MPLTQLVFMAVLLAALTSAFSRGGRTERIGAFLIVAAALSTPLAEARVFAQVESGIAVIDAALLAGLLALAFTSRRRWPIYAASFQAVCVLTHLARQYAGAIDGEAYAIMAAFWSYPVLLMLLWGSLVETRFRAPGSPWQAIDPAAVDPAEPHDDRSPASADDRALLTRLLMLHDVGPTSGALASQLLDRAGSFAAAITTPAATLRSWGTDARVVDAFAFARQTTRSALRRKLETRPSMANGDLAVDYLFAELAHLPHEQFRVLYLNARHRLVHDEIHSEGTVTEASVFPREIIKRALEVGAVHLILAHNHPGGDPTPSRADIAITRSIGDAARSLGVSVLDHIVVSATGHVSMRETGWV